MACFAVLIAHPVNPVYEYSTALHELVFKSVMAGIALAIITFIWGMLSYRAKATGYILGFILTLISLAVCDIYLVKVYQKMGKNTISTMLSDSDIKRIEAQMGPTIEKLKKETLKSLRKEMMRWGKRHADIVCFYSTIDDIKNIVRTGKPFILPPAPGVKAYVYVIIKSIVPHQYDRYCGYYDKYGNFVFKYMPEGAIASLYSSDMGSVIEWEKRIHRCIQEHLHARHTRKRQHI